MIFEDNIFCKTFTNCSWHTPQRYESFCSTGEFLVVVGRVEVEGVVATDRKLSYTTVGELQISHRSHSPDPTDPTTF